MPDAAASRSPAEHARRVRRGALRLLYQLDLRGEKDAEAIRQDALDAHLGAIESDDLPPLDPAQAAEAYELALAAHRDRRAADNAVAEFAPQWPAHRQPAIDRVVLRLAHHEMTAGRINPKHAISEAIDLAKQFGSERSPAFINAVLDKVLKRLLAARAGAPTDPAAQEEGV